MKVNDCGRGITLRLSLDWPVWTDGHWLRSDLSSFRLFALVSVKRMALICCDLDLLCLRVSFIFMLQMSVCCEVLSGQDETAFSFSENSSLKATMS